MVKKTLFLLVFLLATVQFGMANVPEVKSLTPNFVDGFECNNPPPDSFRIVTTGSTFMTLGWEPDAINSRYMIEAFEGDGVGGWIPFKSFVHIPGPTITVDGLTPGNEYQFEIATECIDGGHGPKDQTSGLALIVELTIGGGNPFGTEVVECEEIPYSNNRWVGFKVEKIEKELIEVVNYFQVKIIFEDQSIGAKPKKVLIKRVEYDHPIVATDETGWWPTNDDPSLSGANPFRLGYVINEPIEPSLLIGRVDVQAGTNSLTICPNTENLDEPWNANYLFTPIAELPGVTTNEDRSLENIFQSTLFPYQRGLFVQRLSVFIPEGFFAGGNLELRLINTSGEVVRNSRINIFESVMSIDGDNLPVGVYLLNLRDAVKSYTLKVFKSN